MKIIYGPKGTGKTKAIIEMANKALDNAKGHVVFVTDTNRYTYDLKYQIRFLDVNSFAVNNVEAFKGFIKGLIGANSDNEYIFVDGVARICQKNISEIGDVFTDIEKLEKDYGVNFVLTISCSKEDLPDFVLKYAD